MGAAEGKGPAKSVHGREAAAKHEFSGDDGAAASGAEVDLEAGGSDSGSRRGTQGGLSGCDNGSEVGSPKAAGASSVSRARLAVPTDSAQEQAAAADAPDKEDGGDDEFEMDRSHVDGLQKDLNDAESRVKQHRGDRTQVWGLFLGFKAFVLSFVSKGTLACRHSWAPLSLMVMGLGVAAPSMYTSTNEHDRQHRRATACRHQLRKACGWESKLRMPRGVTSRRVQSWEPGVLTATAGGLHVHHRHWPGALAVGAMSLVSSVFLFAVRHILCL